MKIQILKDTMAGGQLVRAGDTITASDADGRLLVGMGKAVEVSEPAAPVVLPEPVEAPKRKPRTKVTQNGDLPANP
jgi:hypothetical protein